MTILRDSSNRIPVVETQAVQKVTQKKRFVKKNEQTITQTLKKWLLTKRSAKSPVRKTSPGVEHSARRKNAARTCKKIPHLQNTTS